MDTVAGWHDRHEVAWSGDRDQAASAVVAEAVVLGTDVLAVASKRRGGRVRPRRRRRLSGLGWESDFESRALRVFAENGGSLSYCTPRVDPTATVYYEPHG